MVEMLDPQSISAKLFMVLPMLICFVTSYFIRKANWKMIGGSDCIGRLSKKTIRKFIYIRKTFYLSLALSIPFIFSFFSSFFIKDMTLFNVIIMTSWMVFISTLIGGMVLINATSKRRY